MDYLLFLVGEQSEIKSVANVTHFDVREFLETAAKIPIRPLVQTYLLEEANKALIDLKRRPGAARKFWLLDLLRIRSREIGRAKSA